MEKEARRWTDGIKRIIRAAVESFPVEEQAKQKLLQRLKQAEEQEKQKEG